MKGSLNTFSHDPSAVIETFMATALRISEQDDDNSVNEDLCVVCNSDYQESSGYVINRSSESSSVCGNLLNLAKENVQCSVRSTRDPGQNGPCPVRVHKTKIKKRKTTW